MEIWFTIYKYDLPFIIWQYMNIYDTIGNNGYAEIIMGSMRDLASTCRDISADYNARYLVGDYTCMLPELTFYRLGGQISKWGISLDIQFFEAWNNPLAHPRKNMNTHTHTKSTWNRLKPTWKLQWQVGLRFWKILCGHFWTWSFLRSTWNCKGAFKKGHLQSPAAHRNRIAAVSLLLAIVGTMAMCLNTASRAWCIWEAMTRIWLVVWLPFYIFPYIGNNHPNWPIFFRGVQTTNQEWGHELSAVHLWRPFWCTIAAEVPRCPLRFDRTWNPFRAIEPHWAPWKVHFLWLQLPSKLRLCRTADGLDIMDTQTESHRHNTNAYFRVIW